MRIKLIANIIVLLLCTCAVAAQSRATVREYKKEIKTYPFSDPDPIPNMGKIYPYFRFDGFTNQAVNQVWKVVELENEFLKVLVLPELGGKVWTAIEKSSGKPFIYHNQVIKFRDIAMRGPWTSGGIEANYGIIGHTPNVATPVDYETRLNPDGSVSCFIGTLDLLTRSNWRIEIKLSPGKAFFTTTSFWMNNAQTDQPYYTWMNVGLPAKGNLQFIYPGNYYIGHEGESSNWPENRQFGKDISFYENNDFGGAKSYHVIGKYTDFFGAYWHETDFGMGRYAPRDEKSGKKIWIWGLAPQGMIWEKLLTDQDGQYVEVQSGRLFNQAAERSTLTPFKHHSFAPYQVDEWTEYWFPVKGTRGFVKANQYGALNVIEENAEISLYFCALQAVDDKLEVFDGDTKVYEKRVVLQPMQTFSDTLLVKVNAKDLRVALGGNKVEYFTKTHEGDLARPTEMPRDFDWNSVYGLWLQGKQNLHQRFYQAAKAKLVECLQKDPNYAPALVDLAMLEYRNLEYEKALTAAKKALSINTYDAGANYYYALSQLQLGNLTDAKDGFDIASLSPAYRAAAYTELAQLALRSGQYQAAGDYLAKAFIASPQNQTVATLRRVLARKDRSATPRLLTSGFENDVLNPFVKAEAFLHDSTPENQKALLNSIKNELPQETILELAAFYFRLHFWDDARKILLTHPPNAEAQYWLAYLDYQQNGKQWQQLLQQAHRASPQFVFPFRAESETVFKWATTHSKVWQPKYYLALIYWNRDSLEKAAPLLQACGSEPDFAPFYAARANVNKLTSASGATADLRLAMEIDPQQWRYGKLLAERLLAQKVYPEALTVAAKYYNQHPKNYQLGLLLARTLLVNRQFQRCSELLNSIEILPYEGATEGRRLYRITQLMLAIEKMRERDFATAIRQIETARLWPENLGVGKPYPSELDERLEYWLLADCYRNLQKPQVEEAALRSILAYQERNHSIGTLIKALALQRLNRAAEASALLQRWVDAEPQNPVGRWAQTVLQGRPAAIEWAASEQDLPAILHAWLSINK